MGRRTDALARLERLREVLAGAQSLLIVMQDNPDPDALAAAAALRLLAHDHSGIRCTLAAEGSVSRAENVALLRYLDLNIRPLSELDPARFDLVGMVDAQPGGAVKLPEGLRLDIVIDHHPMRQETRAARLTDVRKRYGATSTILCEYLKAGGLEIGAQLATALLYGIRSDTQDLGRETTRADIEATWWLTPKANVRALARIMSPPLPRAYFSELRRALDAATIYGDRLVSILEEVASADMVAETADLLLRVEGVRFAMCAGVVDSGLALSFRLSETDPAASAVAEGVVKGYGSGGGHQTYAGAQVPLPEDPDKRRELIERLVKRFLKATGSPSAKPEPLCER